jgi:hypothetical protein
VTDADVRRRPERDLLETVAGALRARGYRTYLDPDGTDYFDLVVRRADEVGVIEGKAGGASNVLSQALVRRPWADWVAVVVGSARAAERLVARTQGHRAEFVGVWSCVRGQPRELRAARTVPPGAGDPFAATRARLRTALDALDRGELPVGVRWSGVAGEVRRASAGRRYREWRLDELAGPDA